MGIYTPPYLRRVDFAFDADGWDLIAIDDLSTILCESADVFSFSKLDNDKCSQRPFEIKVPDRSIRAHTASIRSYRNKQTIYYIPILLLASFSVRLKMSGGIHITIEHQEINKVPEIPQVAVPRVEEVLGILCSSSIFSVFEVSSGITQLTIDIAKIPPTAFCMPSSLYE